MLQKTLQRGSIVYLISDFADLDSECNSYLYQLACEHTVFAIHILDPAELNLPRLGKLRCVHPDTRQESRIDTNSSTIRHAYKQLAHTHVEQIKENLSAIGITYKQIDTSVSNLEQHLPRTA